MSDQAPHLPDDFHVGYRRAFFVLLTVVSVLAGVAGGAMAVWMIVPDVLHGVIQSLPLSYQARDADVSAGQTPFSDMISLAQTLTSASGESVASGVTFTSDGWIVTDADAVRRASHVRIDAQLVRIASAQVIVDKPSGVAFFNVAQNAFSSPRLSDGARFTAGDEVYVVSDEMGVLEARVSVPYGRIDSPTGVFEAHEFHRVIVLDRRVPDVLAGAPVFDTRGSLAGVVTFHPQYEHQALVIPVHHFTQSFKDVVKSGAPSHAYLGVRYKPANVSGVDLSLFQPGQRVEGSPSFGVSAVRYNSPAWRAGLRDGDRILAIEGNAVGVRDTLPDVLARYEPGQRVTIRYERNGEEHSVQVELGVAP